MVKKEVISLIKQYLVLLKREGINIDNAFLYGSYANDTASVESDIDLLITSKQFDSADDYLFGKIWVLAKSINSKIEPYIVGLNRYSNDEISPLIQIVKKQGLEII